MWLCDYRNGDTWHVADDVSFMVNILFLVTCGKHQTRPDHSMLAPPQHMCKREENTQHKMAEDRQQPSSTQDRVDPGPTRWFDEVHAQ